MGAKAAIGLLVVALSLFLLLFRRRPQTAEAANHPTTISTGEIRQRLENARASYQGKDPEDFHRAIDSFVASLRARYGEEVPVRDVAGLLREFRLSKEALPQSQITPGAGVTSVGGEKIPDGVKLEWMPAGFLLRVSCGSLVTGAPWAVFAGVIAVLPFKLWGDLIRGVWTDEGLSLWLTCAFLAIWACAVLYVGATAAVGLFGEIRIAKDGDRGGIFTGIGRAGWTHRLEWSEFDGVSERDVDSVSSGSSTHTSHYVGLNGPGKRYKFGSELTKQQQAFVIAFLREHVFESGGTARAPLDR